MGSPTEQQPTSVRHWVLAFTTLMAVLLYLDRVCIAVMAPRISVEYCFSKVEIGIVFSIFFFAYALAQVPAGWLGDRWGARIMLTGCVLAWSVFTALTGFMTSLWVLLISRLILGICQAGAYPIAARINSLWTPFQNRAFASSMIALGGRAGGALAPIATVFLMVLFGGWRPVLWYYALLGVAWALLFWRGFRATPAEHPTCNQVEVELIENSRPVQASSPHGVATSIPWSAACRSLSLWMQCLTQFTGNVAWVFLITWLPTYLMEVHEVDEANAGLLSSMPLLAGMGGCFLGGMASDRLTRRLGLKWGRNLLGMFSKYLAAAGFVAAVVANDPILATVALAFASFSTDTGLGATWAYFQDAGGQYVGTLLGWANMFGNFGAAVGPLLLGWMAQEYSWKAALATSAGICVASGVCWFWVDARIPIVRPVAG
jgi:sugar phosphate permease